MFSKQGKLTAAAVLVILVASSGPNLVRVHCGAGSGMTACFNNLKNFGTALEMYSTDHGGRYPSSPPARRPARSATSQLRPATPTSTPSSAAA